MWRVRANAARLYASSSEIGGLLNEDGDWAGAGSDWECGLMLVAWKITRGSGKYVFYWGVL